MKDLHYFTAWTDSECLLGCDHEHKTVTAAAACSSTAGSYVVAVENGKLRQLNDSEETEFQDAMYGKEEAAAQTPEKNLLVRVSMLIRIQLDPKG